MTTESAAPKLSKAEKKARKQAKLAAKQAGVQKPAGKDAAAAAAPPGAASDEQQQAAKQEAKRLAKAERKAAKKAAKAAAANGAAASTSGGEPAAAAAAAQAPSSKKQKHGSSDDSDKPAKKQKKDKQAGAAGGSGSGGKQLLAAVGDAQLATSSQPIVKQLYTQPADLAGMSSAAIEKQRAERSTAVEGPGSHLAPLTAFQQVGLGRACLVPWVATQRGSDAATSGSTRQALRTCPPPAAAHAATQPSVYCPPTPTADVAAAAATPLPADGAAGEHAARHARLCDAQPHPGAVLAHHPLWSRRHCHRCNRQWQDTWCVGVLAAGQQVAASIVVGS
jgi:hypothetical protein